jgi:acetyl esterase/lipase
MTTVFFLFSLVIGWMAFNLYQPATRRPGWSVFSFLFGWPVGELAIHHIAWQVFVVFVFVWAGALNGFLGALGFVICVLTWLALGYFYFTGERAGPAMETALQETLGKGYRDSIREEFRSRFPPGPDFRRIRLPFGKIDENVEVIRDVSFGRHDQQLDIYRPRRSLENSPVLLQIHGGAWTENMGSKERQAIPLMTHMALRNWISVSINYRLSPAATFPEHLIDCKEGLKWIKEHIRDYGGDPDFVVATGGSAGGHLSAMVALTAGDSRYQPGFEDANTQVQGAVPFYGVYDFTDEHWTASHKGRRDFIGTSVMKLAREDHGEEYRLASPLHRVHANAPPFLVIHGNMDSLVPVSQARTFVERLKEVSSNPVAYAEIEGAQHAFDMFASIRSEHTKQGVERFLTYLYSRYLAKIE